MCLPAWRDQSQPDRRGDGFQNRAGTTTQHLHHAGCDRDCSSDTSITWLKELGHKFFLAVSFLCSVIPYTIWPDGRSVRVKSAASVPLILSRMWGIHDFTNETWRSILWRVPDLFCDLPNTQGLIWPVWMEREAASQNVGFLLHTPL